ncbi:response regulator [Patescibacteria group bacterium]|nr:response regulator [Patescibacteria group bacterium]MBU1074652.1 response regulator [Patescibacteria group bacterium]MBU1952263.1 response regulator [Patescibacteria group bacterium]
MSKKKILVIEDEKPLINALSAKLQNEGFQVVEANDGKSGLKAALKHKPDLILLDIILPKMDGIGILENLRENAWGKSAKVIILTNLSDWDSTKKAVNLNVHDYLVKSDWNIKDVVKKVKSKLK